MVGNMAHSPLPLDYDAADTLVVSEPAQLRALGDEVRGRIIALLRERAASASELAGLLEMPKGTVGHHLKVLERAGLVHVVRTRRVRAVTEKYYGRVARLFLYKSCDENADELVHGVAAITLRIAAAELAAGRRSRCTRCCGSGSPRPRPSASTAGSTSSRRTRAPPSPPTARSGASRTPSTADTERCGGSCPAASGGTATSAISGRRRRSVIRVAGRRFRAPARRDHRPRRDRLRGRAVRNLIFLPSSCSRFRPASGSTACRASRSWSSATWAASWCS